MKTRLALTALLSSAIVVGVAFIASSQPRPRPVVDATSLRAASSFDNIKDRRARSVALFQEAGKVIQHAR